MAYESGSTSAAFPPGRRWLDLFAGTGAVGLEALSRGCADAHFVELDPWVINNCLHKNIDHTRFTDAATVHQQRVESFLEAAEATPRFAGGAFDYISVCPPYDKVRPHLRDIRRFEQEPGDSNRETIARFCRCSGGWRFRPINLASILRPY